MSKTIYFAGPLFSRADIEYNQRTVKELRDFGFKVILPQEEAKIDNVVDLYILAQLNPTEEKLEEICQADLDNVKKSDIIICNLSGTDADSGTCVEVGYAYALNKSIYGLKEDYRTFSKIEDVNLMLLGACNRGIYHSFKELRNALFKAERDEP